MVAANEDLELRRAFFTESADTLSRLQAAIEALEENPGDSALVDTIFREVHTIKGNSSFLGLPQITKLSHAGEALLDKFRKKELAITPDGLRLITEVYQALKILILEQEVDRDISAVVEHVENFYGQKPQVPASSAPKVETVSETKKVSIVSSVRVDEHKLAKISGISSELDIVRYGIEKVSEKMELPDASMDELHFELDLQATKLTRLINSLSSVIHGVRLVPVSTVFQRFPKVVSDLGKKLGKQIELRIMNGDAELDKNIVEAIADPMIHLIRNSVDHGIESQEERVKAGKRPIGRITLNSFVRGNFVYIEISDDGRGIDGDKILLKAIEKGIVPKEKMGMLSNAQKRALIFSPGFSTADQVTDISGRGVGMDVVKSNINKLKGTVIIDSIVGRGTVIQLRLPMSLVVLFSLFIKVSETVCAFPVNLVDESYDYPASTLLEKVPAAAPASDYLALYSLSTLLWGFTEEKKTSSYHVLRFRLRGGANIGFIVDEFSSIEEALIQSVDSYIAALPGIQGATVRKDGTVGLMLNPQSLIDLSKRVKPMAYVKIEAKASEADAEANLLKFLESEKSA